MEKIVRKTITAFLVLLTIMIPVSAGIYAPASNVIPVTEGDQMINVTFSYDNTSLSAGAITLAFAGDAVLDNTQTGTLITVTGQDTLYNVSTPLASGLAEGNHTFTLNVSQDTTVGSVTTTWSDVLTYTVKVSAATLDVACEDLVTNDDGELEDEYNPGDTVTLELELENDQCENAWTDVMFEAWIRNDEGRISSIEDTAEFNLGEDEEETVSFNFDLDEDLSEGDYTVYARATADEADDLLWEESYSFEVERDEHNILITDVQYDANAQAGETVDVAVTILNNGQGDEDNVRIGLSVAGASQTSSYFTIEEDEEVVRYFTLTLPSGANGEELLVVRAANADASDSYSGSINVGAVAATDSASLTEAQIEALLDARLSGDGEDSGVSFAWIIAGLLLVWILHQNGGRTKPTRGRKKSKKVYY